MDDRGQLTSTMTPVTVGVVCIIGILIVEQVGGEVAAMTMLPSIDVPEWAILGVLMAAYGGFFTWLFGLLYAERYDLGVP